MRPRENSENQPVRSTRAATECSPRGRSRRPMESREEAASRVAPGVSPGVRNAGRIAILRGEVPHAL